MKISTQFSQKGAALLLSIIMLLIVTLLAVASMRGVILEERLVGNSRDRQAATNGAESALREAETRLANNFGPPVTTTNCTSIKNLCVLKTLPNDMHLNDWPWWENSANSIPYKGNNDSTTNIYGLKAQPRWHAAYIGFDPQNSKGAVEVTDIDLRRRGVGPHYYQINATSQGFSGRIMVNLQTTSVQRY